MSANSERQFALTSADGIELRAWLATPAEDPVAALVLCHGLTTDASEHGAFRALRDHALKRDLAVARLDFRAHGESGGSNEQLTLAGLRADVDALLALVDQELGGALPVVPLGVSFGGAAAIHAAATRTPCAGLALWYAVVDYAFHFGPDSPVPFTRRMRAAADPDHDPAWSAMPVLGTRYHLPAALVEETVEDPTPRTLAALEVPVLCYYGSRDELVDVGPVRAAAKARSGIDLRVAWGAGHGFLLWRPWVIRRTVSWAARVAHGIR